MHAFGRYSEQRRLELKERLKVMCEAIKCWEPKRTSLERLVDDNVCLLILPYQSIPYILYIILTLLRKRQGKKLA